MGAFFSGLKTGCAEAWRGYFAPLRLSPWQAAINAARDPVSRWFTPFTAWVNEIDRIVKR